MTSADHADTGENLPFAFMDRMDEHCGFLWPEPVDGAHDPARLRAGLDALETCERFEVRFFADFDRFDCNGYAYPRVVRFMDADHGSMCESSPWWRAGCGSPFDYAPWRRTRPSDLGFTSMLAIRYQADLWESVGPDWDRSFLRRILLAHDLHAHGLLTDRAADAQPGVLAVELTRAGVVLPVPDGCVVQWETHGDELALYTLDAAALARSMRRYPHYYDPVAAPSADDVERDIAGCVQLLEQIRDRHLNPLDMALPESRLGKEHA